MKAREGVVAVVVVVVVMAVATGESEISRLVLRRGEPRLETDRRRNQIHARG